MSENSLLILETLSEARFLVDDLLAGDNVVKSCEFLSLHPNVRCYLRENQLKSLSTSEVMDAKSFQTVMDKCEEMESYIRRELVKQNIEQPPDYFINSYWFFLRLIWRHLLWNIELLDGCLKKKPYERIYAFKYNRPVTLSPWMNLDDQLYMGDIAERFCRARGIEMITLQSLPLAPRTLEQESSASLYQTLCNRMSYFLSRLSMLFVSQHKTLIVPSFKYNMNKVCDDLIRKDSNLKVGIFYMGKRGAIEVLRSLAILCHLIAGKKIYASSVGYPVDFAFSTLTMARCHLKSFSDHIERKYVDATIKAIEDGNNSKMIFKGVGLSDLLVQKILKDLTPYMQAMSFQAFGLRKGLEAIKPDFILSQVNFEIYGALGAVAKEMDIPSVLVSHGSHVLHKDKYGARENDILARNILVGDYRYSAVQSPLAREIALKMTNEPERIVNIKPSLWGRAVTRTHDKKGTLTIVHAGSLKLRHNRRFIYETSDEFLQGMTELIEAIAPFPRLRLILKIRPDIYELSLDTMKALLPSGENVIVEADKPFLDVLPEADLVVSFSSTTIEEALSNKIPVLLYGGDGRYCHIPVEPFSETNNDIARAVTFVKDREHLKTYMSILNENAFFFHVPDDAFRNYRFIDSEVVNLTEWIMGLCATKK